jgi:hypothetical protein
VFVQFLAEHGLMDYSLLVGVHWMTMHERKEPSYLLGELPVMRSFGVEGFYEEPAYFFFGIIDYLQEWNPRKRLEGSIKSLLYPQVRRPLHHRQERE